uniref:Uncharacterized protein n=1 Tax=Globodera rostochiensis TaxID=31243 RepID=A0A914I8Q9_GLORO
MKTLFLVGAAVAATSIFFEWRMRRQNAAALEAARVANRAREAAEQTLADVLQVLAHQQQQDAPVVDDGEDSDEENSDEEDSDEENDGQEDEDGDDEDAEREREFAHAAYMRERRRGNFH